MTATGSSAITVRPHPSGPEWGTVLESADPWYRLAHAVAALFLAGEIDEEGLADWETWLSGNGQRRRDLACPAARQLVGHLALTWMEPHYEGIDRRARLRELMGGVVTYRPTDVELAQMAPADAYALGYTRGHTIATSRAVSRADLGLRIEDRKSNENQRDDQMEPIGVE